MKLSSANQVEKEVNEEEGALDDFYGLEDNRKQPMAQREVERYICRLSPPKQIH